MSRTVVELKTFAYITMEGASTFVGKLARRIGFHVRRLLGLGLGVTLGRL